MSERIISNSDRGCREDFGYCARRLGVSRGIQLNTYYIILRTYLHAYTLHEEETRLKLSPVCHV
jgi:hypothetical protein